VPSRKRTDDSTKNRRKAFSKTLILLLLAFLVFIFATIAWFAMNRSNTTEGMGVKVEGKNYLLTSTGADSATGSYYDPYHETLISQGDSDGCVWKLTNDSNIGNFSQDPGIEPGTHGKLQLYLTPYVDSLTLSFCFELIGYNADTEGIGAEEHLVMNEVTSSTLKNYINGHILLFSAYDEEDGYSGLISSDSEMKRVVEESFENKKDQRQTVTFYWVWPYSLSELIGTVNQASNDEETQKYDYDEMGDYICENPHYFLKGYSGGSIASVDVIRNDYVTYGTMYDAADNDLGSAVGFLLLKLDAEEAGL